MSITFSKVKISFRVVLISLFSLGLFFSFGPHRAYASGPCDLRYGYLGYPGDPPEISILTGNRYMSFNSAGNGITDLSLFSWYETPLIFRYYNQSLCYGIATTNATTSFVTSAGTFLSSNPGNTISAGNSRIYNYSPCDYSGANPNRPATYYPINDPGGCQRIADFIVANPYIDGYSVYLRLNPLPWFDDSGGVSSVIKEDAVIDKIASAGKITISAAGNTFDIPATNCVKLAGNGPRKVVFMRGKSWNVGVNEFLENVQNSTINQGFRTIEPFKSYFDQFSFYIDLRKIDDGTLPTFVDPDGDIFYDNDAGDIIRSQSACAGAVSDDPRNQYILYHDRADMVNAYALPTPPTPIINVHVVGSTFYKIEITTLHELGHSLGRLFDEYRLGP